LEVIITHKKRSNKISRPDFPKPYRDITKKDAGVVEVVLDSGYGSNFDIEAV
jgi:hypothetical protein